MPKMKKCTICGKSFLSCKGVEVCSAACATERKRRQDTAGNERRRLQLSNQKTSRICPVCGKTFMSVYRKYCCSECAEIARRKKFSRKQPGILRPKSGCCYTARKSYAGKAQAGATTTKIKVFCRCAFMLFIALYSFKCLIWLSFLP